MKKITILAIAALAISFASCKKDRTCTCSSTSTTTMTGATTGTSSNSSTDVTTLNKVSKKAGKVNCISNKYTYVQDFGGTTYTTVSDNKCTLS